MCIRDRHLYYALKLEDKKVYRITFNEITKSAVKESLKHAREIDICLLYTSMRIVQEMYARGFEFEPIDIFRAQSRSFQIVDGKLMPSLNSIDGLGEKAADAIVEAAKDGPFLSKDDFRQRTKVSKTIIDLMDSLEMCIRDSIQGPVLLRNEGIDLILSVADDPQSHRLYAACLLYTSAMGKASTALQYTVAIRDKVMEAYKELMQIQI